MLMGNKHSNRASSAAPTMKTTSSSPRISRNGSQKSQGAQPALAEAAVAAAAAAVTATASAGTSDLASSSLNQQHLADMVESCQPIQLSTYQKHLLREAWQKINKKGTGSIGTLIFRRMFSKNPEIKQVFQHVTVIEGVFGFGLTPMQAFHHHSVLFVQVLDSAIEQLDDLRPFVKKCVEYGAKHAPYRNYGFKADMWDIFGECMTEAAREWEGWKKHRETIRAWTILVSFIVDRMRQGYETAVRRQCFMQQLSTKQSGSSIEAPDNDDESTSLAVPSDNSKKQGSGSPRRRLAAGKVNTSQENASAVAADDQQEREQAWGIRMARAESQ